MNKLLTTPPKKNADPGDKKTDRHSFLAIRFSIFVALVLWFYVQDAEAPDYTKTFTSIPVKIQSLSSSFSVLEGGGTAVDVTLIGKRSTLNKIKVSDLEAYLDLTNVNQSGHYEPEVSVMLPEGTELFDCFPKKASLFIDETVSAEVEVSVELGSYRVPENTGIEAKSLVDVISVKGPKTILSRIEKAKVVTGDLGDVSSSFEKNLEYQFYDDKGNVVESRHIVVPEQNVKVQFSVFKTRVVP
ncbi:MAG: hypothetical protein IKC69_05570, partial [Clostridia bacterium]|nr:hypothetical protein [Clostridia bacterium]